MGLVSLTTITNGTLADATTIMGNYNAIAAQVNGNLDTANISPVLLAQMGVSDPANVRSGSSIIATSESRTNSAVYNLLATPDRVANIVVPNGGIIEVLYQATWQESVSNQSRAAIFVGANQLKVAIASGVPLVEEAYFGPGSALNTDTPLASFALGLLSANGAGAPSSDVTTGQVIGLYGGNFMVGLGAQNVIDRGGPARIFVAPGTYDVSVQFKIPTGTVTVKNRRLYVKVIGF